MWWSFTKTVEKEGYWIIHKTFTGLQITRIKGEPKLYGLDKILDGPFDTKEEAIQSFKFWSENKHERMI